MDKLVYLYYPILIGLLFWGAQFYGRGSWNEGFLSLKQTKALQGFCAICIMLHHIGQKTCAFWLSPRYIIHGLDLFVPFGYYFVGIFLFCSGYGLYESYRSKPNYLQGFFGRRMLPVMVAFYSTGLIFLGARLLMGEKLSIPQLLLYLSGLQLCNPNTWFVIALPILYLGFYLSFRFCKTEKAAVAATCLYVLAYTILGTLIDHNDWWMRGEWWYNSVHFFSLGILFACHKEKIIENVKKHYVLYLVLAFVLMFVFYGLSEYTQSVFSYYGETFHADFKVLRRWVCLLAQMAASCSFVFLVFMGTMKIEIGNRFLAFMGAIALEFYLNHCLFIELLGYSFLDTVPSLYYIKNMALMVAAVFLPSIPLAVLVQRFDRWVVHLLTKQKRIKKKIQK